jgi:hypothetical protein
MPQPDDDEPQDHEPRKPTIVKIPTRPIIRDEPPVPRDK